MRDFEITDEMLYNSAPKAEEIILSKIPDDKDLNHKFSRRFEKKMNRLIKEEKRHPAVNKLYLYTKRTAVIFIIVATGLLTVTFSVESLRTRFINMVIKIYEEYTSIRINSDMSNGSINSSNLPYPRYMSSEFKEISKEESDSDIFISYSSNNDSIIDYQCFIIDKYSASIDSEDSNSKNVLINNNTGKYIVTEDVQTIFWNDEKYTYMIQVISSKNTENKISIEELIKISENIK